jgi:hypothetical protein
MKRLCLILAYLFLFTQTASAMPLLVGQKVVYRGTITGLRISAVDGTAFIDDLPLKYSSDFSAGVDGWTGLRATPAGNIDDIPSTDDDWLRCTINNENALHSLLKNNILTIGRKYRITFKYYIPSGQTALGGILLTRYDGVDYSGITYQSTLDAITTYTVDITAGDVGLRLYATTSLGSKLVNDPGGDDVFYIKDVTISEIQPFMDGNHSIEIYDSSNRMLKGVLKAAGTSETLGDELATSWSNASGHPFETFTTSGNTITSAQNTSGNGRCDIGSISPLILTKTVMTVSKNDHSIVYMEGTTAGNISFPVTIMTGLNFGSYTKYQTINTAKPVLGFVTTATTGEFILSAYSLKQVLTPSALGATIVSAKAGETYNWKYKDASFTYNAASYYVIIRAIR